MEEKKTKKLIGGIEMAAFGKGKENVIPVSFIDDDPFYDLPGALSDIDKDCKSGDLKDIIILKRTKGEVLSILWRGGGSITTALGLIEYCKTIIIRGFENDGNKE